MQRRNLLKVPVIGSFTLVTENNVITGYTLQQYTVYRLYLTEHQKYRMLGNSVSEVLLLNSKLQDFTSTRSRPEFSKNVQSTS